MAARRRITLKLSGDDFFGRDDAGHPVRVCGSGLGKIWELDGAKSVDLVCAPRKPSGDQWVTHRVAPLGNSPCGAVIRVNDDGSKETVVVYESFGHWLFAGFGYDPFWLAVYV